MSFTPVSSRVQDENMSSTMTAPASSKKRKRMSDPPKDVTKRSTLAATNGNTEPVQESFTENEHDGSEPDISTTAAAALTAHLNEGRNMSFGSTGSNTEERPTDESFNNMESSSRYPYSPTHSAGRTNGSGQKPAVGSDEWHRVRRDNHKEVERRRRETINEGINELAKIVPGSDKNKGAVLARAVTYIADLKSRQELASEQKSMEKSVLEQAVNELMSRNEEYKERNSVLEDEVRSLKEEMRDLKKDKGKKD